MSTDVFTPEQRSAVMRAVPGKNSSPELKVRKLLTGMGARYRLHRRDLPGSPDIVLVRRRIALFVHGCFWHGHDCARGDRQPKANASYWSAKIARNRARDAGAMAALSAQGWRPVIVWECELKDSEVLEHRLAKLLQSDESRPGLDVPAAAPSPASSAGGTEAEAPHPDGAAPRSCAGR